MNKKNRTVKGTLLISILMIMTIWMSMSCFADAAVKKPAQVKSVKVTASGKTKHKVKWKKIKGVTGYQVYCRDYSSSSKLFKKVATVKGASKTSCTIKNRKAGKAYAYVVRAYKKVGKKKYYGKLSAYAYGYIMNTSSKPNSDTSSTSGNNTSANGNNNTGANTGSTTTQTLASDIIVNPTEKQKYKKVFNNSSLSMRYPGGYYTSSSKAKANMKSITVKTWDFKKGKSGEKITRTWTIQVHKSLASTVQQIFKEIYEGKEKFPIHELGGYSWRGGHSEHNTGTAIDINWTENYMVNIKTGVITAGKYWKPGVDPYSIPKDGEVAKIFKKYGFSQGDWGNSKDYMHFSYFGT